MAGCQTSNKYLRQRWESLDFEGFISSLEYYASAYIDI